MAIALKNTQLRKILLVEDNRTDEILIQYKLQSMLPNAQIVTVQTIHEAYKAYKEHDFDLILLDLNLPDAFGSNAVSQIKMFSRDAPIVVLTGYANPVTIDDVIQQGATHVSQKSELMSPEFENMIAAYLD